MGVNLYGSSLQESDSIVTTVLMGKDLAKEIEFSYNEYVMDAPEDSFRNPPVPNSTSDLFNTTADNHTVAGSEDRSNVLPTGDLVDDFSLLPPTLIWMTFIVFKYVLVPSLLLKFGCNLWEKYCVGLRDKTSHFPLPDGRMGLPFIGEMFHFLFLGVSFQRARRKEFGPIYRTHLFGRPTIRVSGEKYIKKLLLGEGHLVETKWPYTTQVILGSDGIVNGSKETHTTIKKLTLRALSPRFMETYAPSVQKSIQAHVAKWIQNGEVFILEECKKMIAHTMMTVLLGIEENDPDIQKYISYADDIINGILCIPVDTPYSAWRRGKRAREFIFEQMKTRLKVKMECSNEELFGHSDLYSCQSASVDEIAASTGHPDSVLVNIIKIARLEGENTIKLKNLQNLSLEIIFAGTQSLQSSTSMLVLHLSRNPEVLHRLRDEIRINGLWDIPLEQIPYKKVNSLTYASHVVNEVLRVTPPIPGAIRVAKKTFELGGCQIPKGWQVMFSIRETHEIASGKEKPLQAVHLPYDPSYFSCAKCESAENVPGVVAPRMASTDQTISDHKCHNRNGPFSFIPFGKGARMCAGVNYALFVLRVLAIELARSSDFHHTTPVILKSIPMTKPAHSVRVCFQQHKECSSQECVR